MIPLGECEITAVFGPMASGKTHLIQTEWLPAQNRYVRFDATGESMDDPSVEHIWKSPRQLYERLEKNPYHFRIAYHPGVDIQEDFYFCVKCLWRRVDISKLIVCDEFHEVCNVSDTPAFVQTMMRYARHAKLSVIGASQRIADVHKLFTSGARKTIIFHSREARDLVAVRDRWGSEAAEMVANLRPLLYDDLSKNVRQVPQCLVIEKGSSPKVYDFQSQSYTADSRVQDGSEDDSLPPEEAERDDSTSDSEEQSGAENPSSGLDR